MKSANRPLNVLFYSEPHPYRNSYTEHAEVVRRLLPALSRFVEERQISLRVFSNNEVIDRLLVEMPRSLPFWQRPTNAESRQIQGMFGQWDDAAIARWLDLVRGDGEVTEIYLSILRRLHFEQPIDVILTWSENGAVRRFGEEEGVPVLFGELGPTRPPFPETMYFDTHGTNGHSAFRPIIRRMIEEGKGGFLPAQTWLVRNEIGNENQETACSLLDRGITFSTTYAELLPDRPYIFVPLQLADDLNTLMHSEFSAPLDFLKHAAEQAAKNGYDLVVKGHPGAGVRPYNMRREIEALDYLEQAHPDAVILPRDCPADTSAYVLANAAYVMTINSSVAFEAMILGVPALVLGQAAFDADGWLQENTPLLPADKPRDFRPVLDAIVSANMDHVLVPRDVVLETDYLLNRLRARAADTDEATRLAQESFARWHVSGSDMSGDLLADIPRHPGIGAGMVTPGTRIFRQAGVVLMHEPDNTRVLEFAARQSCIGHIDGLVEDDSENNGYTMVGWAMDTRTMAPPLMVLLVNDDTVVSCHRLLIPREDVGQVIPDLARTPLCGFRFGFRGGQIERMKLLVLCHDGSIHTVPTLGAGLSIQPE